MRRKHILLKIKFVFLAIRRNNNLLFLIHFCKKMIPFNKTYCSGNVDVLYSTIQIRYGSITINTLKKGV